MFAVVEKCLSTCSEAMCFLASLQRVITDLDCAECEMSAILMPRVA